MKLLDEKMQPFLKLLLLIVKMNYTPCNGCIAVLFQLYHYQLASDLFPGIGFPVHCARKGMQNRGKFTLYIKLPCILCSYSSSWMVGHLLELGLPYYLITSTPLCVKKKKMLQIMQIFPIIQLGMTFCCGFTHQKCQWKSF